MIHSTNLRHIVFGALCCAVAACAGKTTEATVTAEQLNALPVLTVSDGTVLCSTMVPADTGCPVKVATANWLNDNDYAVWEPARAIMIYRNGSKALLQPRQSPPEYEYGPVTAVGPGAKSDEILVIDPLTALAHHFRGTEHTGTSTVPPVTNISSWGFYGSWPIWYSMETGPDNLTANVVVRVGKEIGDTKARTAFAAPVKWLQFVGGHAMNYPPLFPNIVIYGFENNGDAVWSDGEKFTIERDRSNGKPAWKISSEVTGPPIDSAEIAAKKAELMAPTSGMVLEPQMVDSMIKRTTGRSHPAINGLVVAPSGMILVARSVTPSRDSVDYVRVSEDGVLLDRFTLPKTSSPVLFGGDSVLVHRTQETLPTALLWLRLKK